MIVYGKVFLDQCCQVILHDQVWPFINMYSQPSAAPLSPEGPLIYRIEPELS